MNIVKAVESVKSLQAPADELAAEYLSAEVIKLYGDSPSIETLEMMVSFFKARRDALLCQTIPELLHESGQSSCTLETGESVVLDLVWNISVPKGEDGNNDYSALSKWLDAQGFGAIIRDSLQFEKGALSEAFLHELADHGLSFSRSSSIHPASLKKVIREHMETGGEAPPANAAIISTFERAKIKG